LNKSNSKSIVIVIILSFFVIFYYLFIISEHFRVQSIEINQTKIISSSEVENVIFENISANQYQLFPRNNIFLLEEENLKKLILEKYLKVEKIDIVKKYPQSLKINITEKNPLIMWCKAEECFYLDINGTAFAREADVDDLKYDKKVIKIIEEKEIAEELALSEKKEETAGDQISLENIDSVDLVESDETVNEDEPFYQKIFLNEKVTDEDFLRFSLSLNEKIESMSAFKVKYYKTKGTKTRELIAYTDKNIRIYFDTTQDVTVQLSYLEDFLSSVIDDNQFNSLNYIYVKAGNKIFYK